MSGFRVVASDTAGVVVKLATRIEDRREADRLAWHWIADARVEAVHVEEELEPPAVLQGNGRFR